jgi:polyribonucleotide nucleotidyltransferase
MSGFCDVCSALIDADVPIRAMVFRISVGLVTTTDDSGDITKSIILMGMVGMEDHFGDMDFKLSGIKRDISRAQLDLKFSDCRLNLPSRRLIRIGMAGWPY